MRIKEVFKSENVDIKFSYYSWEDNLNLLKAGKVDASAFLATRSDRIKDFIYPETHIIEEEYIFISHVDKKFDWEAYQDLKDKKFILNKSYTYNEEFMSFIKNEKVKTIEVESELQSLKMLLKKRVDITIMNKFVFKNQFLKLSSKEQESLFIHPKEAIVSKSYLIFSRENPKRSQKLVKIFEEGFKKIRNKKELQNDFKICGLE